MVRVAHDRGLEAVEQHQAKLRRAAGTRTYDLCQPRGRSPCWATERRLPRRIRRHDKTAESSDSSARGRLDNVEIDGGGMGLAVSGAARPSVSGLNTRDVAEAAVRVADAALSLSDSQLFRSGKEGGARSGTTTAAVSGSSGRARRSKCWS